MTANAILPVQKLDDAATLPTRAHPGDAGLDLYALETTTLAANAGGVLRTGIAIELPAGHVGLVCDRSSLAKRGLKTAGGIIDAGYRGEIGVVVWNLRPDAQTLAKGERIAQLLIMPIAAPAPVETRSLSETARGAGGFGSTGR